MAAAMLGLFAIHRDQLLFGGVTPHLSLENQHRLLHRREVHGLQGAGKSGLAGRGIPAVGPGPNAQRPALRLREYFGESRQGLGPAPSAGHKRANRQGQQRPQRVRLHARPILRHLPEVFAERA